MTERKRDAGEKAGVAQQADGSLEANPLLRSAYRIPFHEIRAEHIEPGVVEILGRARALIDALATDPGPRSYENTLARLDQITQEVRESLHPVHHLRSVAETPEFREAYNAVLPHITQFWSSLPLNEGIWMQVKAFAESEEARGLTGIHTRHLEKTLREFRRAGADLPPEKKVRLEEIRVELARLQQRFSENVLDATASFELHVTDPARLEGIPQGALNRFEAASRERGLEGWILTLDFPSYEPVMKYCADRSLREEMHRAYVGRCRGDAFDNVPLIPRILSLRQEMALILGHPDFADFRLEEAMAKSGQTAADFEEELATRTRPFWERDLAELRIHAATLGISPLAPWDVAFVAEALRLERYDIDDELLRPYFPLDRVLQGLFGLVQRVFGLTIDEEEIREVWHTDVRHYQVRDEDTTWLGSFYTDWFPRKEKRQGAWMHDFLTGGPREDGSFAPHLGFMAGNFSPPEDGRPALLTHREVQTIFHEFGHLLHHLTSRVPIPGRAGLNVAWDWVELPSQIMENWAWEDEALALVARHFETGDPLPGEILERMLSARRFLGGWGQMRQISFGTVDLALHRELAPGLETAETGQEPTDTAAASADSGEAALTFAENRFLPFSPDPSFARSHILTTFTHLFDGGYAAGYYSYLWSEVLDADAFSRFREEGIFNRETGRAFLEAILSRGDSAEPEELFWEFMGRGPDPEALLDRNLGPLPGQS
ncbi:M3 family metallopeptidase [Gemmatimonadota bacterium]